jgi:hypothetical protein
MIYTVCCNQKGYPAGGDNGLKSARAALALMVGDDNIVSQRSGDVPSELLIDRSDKAYFFDLSDDGRRRFLESTKQAFHPRPF